MTDDAAWYVLRTQLKREKLAAANLRQLEGVEVFLPRLKYQKTTRRGRVWWIEPLFPGYLLARFSLAEMGRLVTYTAGVSRMISFGDKVPEVPEEFVKSLQEEVAKVQSSDEEIVVDWKVELGEEVEVAEGPFQGMTGEVVQVRPGSERVSLLLEFLGEPQAVEVSLYSLILARPEIPEGWRGEDSN
ncbi:MAG: transcription termination/antitermination NusG family protein [Akkermansiaceae bacterium]|jgi:transcriptional antiterminator RfaH